MGASTQLFLQDTNEAGCACGIRTASITCAPGHCNGDAASTFASPSPSTYSFILATYCLLLNTYYILLTT